jgi:hypothetical protein
MSGGWLLREIGEDWCDSHRIMWFHFAHSSLSLIYIDTRKLCPVVIMNGAHCVMCVMFCQFQTVVFE